MSDRDDLSASFLAKIYLVVATPALILLCFLTQPLHSLDEPAHFLRVVQLSSGNVRPILGPDRRSTGSIEGEGTERFANFYGVSYSNYRLVRNKTSFAEISQLYRIRNDQDRARFVQHSNSTIYFPLAYAAPVAAVSVVRLVSDRPLVWFYAGRLANALAGAALTYLVLRHASRGRLLFFVVAMLPITLFQMAAFSADSLLLPSAMALALILGRVVDGRPLSTAGSVVAFVAGALVGLGKIAYLPLVVSLPAAALLMRRRLDRTVVGLTLGTVAIVVLWLLWGSEIRNLVFTTRQDPLAGKVDVQGQLALILAHPAVFGRALLSSLHPTYLVRYTVSFIGGIIGWVDTKIPLPVRCLNIAVLIATVVFDYRQRAAPSLVRAGVYLACAASALAVFLLLYLQWNIVGSSQIIGVQGRYFLPLLPFACVVTPALVIPRQRLRTVSYALSAWALISALATIAAVAHRYWL